MKTEINSEQQTTAVKSLTNAVLMALLLVSSTTGLANSNFQQKMLLSPSTGALKAELQGRVMIYDGLQSNVVDMAMDQQFERIENMMFVRTSSVDENGDITVDEDDCD